VKARTTFRMIRHWGAGVVLVGFLLASTAVAQTATQAPDRVTQLRAGMDQAKKDGAKGQLPGAWWDLDKRLDEAKKNGATPAQWQELTVDVQHLQSAATFVARMRKQKSGMEAMLGRFDQALHELGALYGVVPDPTLSGTPAARDLLDKLNRSNLARQILVDSLTVTNRRLNEIVGTRLAYQDSLITALKVEVSSLRQKLWETELRVGVAEADRSAAESVLTRKQQRDEAIADLRSSFGADEGEILLTPEGTIVMRVFGISFGVGSADLKTGQQALIAKIVAAVRLFPGAQIGVEGHTDDTGSRDANLRLSRRRAETVARILEQEMGQENGSITTSGFGPDRPLAPNSTVAGRARNRRIDVIINAAE